MLGTSLVSGVGGRGSLLTANHYKDCTLLNSLCFAVFGYGCKVAEDVRISKFGHTCFLSPGQGMRGFLAIVYSQLA